MRSSVNVQVLIRTGVTAYPFVSLYWDFQHTSHASRPALLLVRKIVESKRRLLAARTRTGNRGSILAIEASQDGSLCPSRLKRSHFLNPAAQLSVTTRSDVASAVGVAIKD
jgi:hypothetical protein